MKAVLKVSGDVFAKNKAERIGAISSMLKEERKKGYTIAVVVGGGPISREYIEIGRGLGLNESKLDLIGIMVTRTNASLLNWALGDAGYYKVVEKPEEAWEAWSEGLIPVAGGMLPGQSTNAVAAVLAEFLQADVFVNATKAGGVYDKNPEVYGDAKLIKEITVPRLRELLKSSYIAGTYELMDQVALNIIERSKINTVIVGHDPAVIRKALYGEVLGTRIIT